jgi:hypothetical protein
MDRFCEGFWSPPDTTSARLLRSAFENLKDNCVRSADVLVARSVASGDLGAIAAAGLVRSCVIPNSQSQTDGRLLSAKTACTIHLSQREMNNAGHFIQPSAGSVCIIRMG